MRQVWLELPYLLQVWYILTILAASMVNRAQLAASLAALFRQHQLGAFLAALFRQHCLTSAKAIKEPQVSHTKSKNSMFHLRSMLFFYSNSLFYLPIRHYSLSPPVALVAESDSPASDASGHTQSVNAG